jgi:hypothetical protein
MQKQPEIRQSRPPRAVMFVEHNTTKNIIFLSLFVLCYTLFAPISAVFAESGDSVVRAGFLVLFIREKYGKKIIKIDIFFFSLLSLDDPEVFSSKLTFTVTAVHRTAYRQLIFNLFSK